MKKTIQQEMTKMTNYGRVSNILVIVESPAKCNKIESYLGQGYKCIASFGHIRQLLSLDAIDVANKFKTRYEIYNDPKKKKHIDTMRTYIANSSEVILATDDDREGEAIAWHICDLFGLPIQTTKRIVFHEITETAIQHAICNPTTIDMNLVYSQQARQILDMLVGYTVTPLLWKYIARNAENSLSAGRCQSPALRLVYDNQQEINKSPGQKVYNTTGYFTNKCIPFELNKKYECETDMISYLENISSPQKFRHMFSRTEPVIVYKQPPEPLTTSRIQQLASNEMHLSPKETMKYCQTLYEEGYITYMRTDSKKYSKDFIDSVKYFILQQYNLDKYIHSQINNLINSETTAISTETAKPNSNTAHEAIRPTNINIKEVDLCKNEKLTAKERRLYKLIWTVSLESCMAVAEYSSITVTIPSYDNTKYSYSAEISIFDGWKIVAKNNKSSETEKHNYYSYLLQLTQNSAVAFKKIASTVSIVKSKSHYTEAKLVQLLEEKGIGRPSTFSSLIDKIQERGYVKKEDIKGTQSSCKDFELSESAKITEINNMREFGNERGKLVIQPIGIIVGEFLNTHFDALFNYEYTCRMEENLDKISKGDMVWHSLCQLCLDELTVQCNKLTDNNKYEFKIDENHYYIVGKYGPVIKCITPNPTNPNNTSISFKPVRKDVDTKRLERNEYKLEDLIEEPNEKVTKTYNILGKYEDEDLILRKGKFGLYVTWGTNSKSVSSLGNRPLDNIVYCEVVELIKSAASLQSDPNNKTPDNNSSIKVETNIVRDITNNISIRKGKYGNYLFYKTVKMRQPKFFKLDGFEHDYISCDKQILQKWISDTHGITI